MPSLYKAEEGSHVHGYGPACPPGYRGVETSKCHCDDENARETTCLDQVLTLKKDENRPKKLEVEKNRPKIRK